MMGEARWWRGKKSWRGQWERKSFPESSVKRRFAKTGALKNHFKFFCVCACLTCCILTHTQASCGMKWFVSAMHKTLVRTVNDLFHGVKRTRKQLKWFGHRHAKFHSAHKIFMKIHFNLFIYLQQSAHYFFTHPIWIDVVVVHTFIASLFVVHKTKCFHFPAFPCTMITNESTTDLFKYLLSFLRVCVFILICLICSLIT